MFYYRIAPASKKYFGFNDLTYHSEDNLPIGSIVEIPLKNNVVSAIVRAVVPRPGKLKTKPISSVFYLALPSTSVKLLDWLMDYYPAPLGATAGQFLMAGLKKNDVSQAHQKVQLKPNKKSLTKIKLPKLTDEQKAAISKINDAANKSYILHGETASGKTRVYIELAMATLKAGRSVIMLAPEIGLANHLYEQIKKVFPGQSIITHSHLSVNERSKLWHQVLHSKKPLIVIGPRSALFVPLKDIGLVVVDECHETAYKQEQAPYYSTVRLAGALSRIHSSKLIMGSATPPIADYWIAKHKGLPVLRLTKPAIQNTNEIKIKIVDLKNKSHFSKHPYLSDEMLEGVGRALKQQEQVLVFLNRRGTATQALCKNCGWQALCSSCNTVLTYHGDRFQLVCHGCGLHEKVPTSCPVCSNPEILFRGTGTKALVEHLTKLFPKAIVRRFDTDNLKAERLESNYQDVVDGKIDILIGTQMLAKGLDLPRLSMVGVVIADGSLAFPDYSAVERTYQLISQVVGRVGRGHRKGEAIIQAYNPESSLLKAAINRDWLQFYENELNSRRQFGFPPFYHLLKLQTARSSVKIAETEAYKLYESLESQGSKIVLRGPAPCFKEKAGGKFCWQIIVKSKTRRLLVDIVKTLPTGWRYDLDPLDLL